MLQAPSSTKFLATLFFTAFLGLFSPAESHANVGEAFGFGSRTGALAGAGASWGSGAFAAYHNPAAIGADSTKRLNIGYGLVYIVPNFLPINNVVSQNQFNSDALSFSDINTSNYRDTLGQVAAFSYRLFPQYRDFSIGVSTFLPIQQLAYLDSGSAYLPEYVLYRARTQRPQVNMGASLNAGRGFRVGAGLQFAFTMTGNSNVFINTKSKAYSSMDFSASMKPKVSPYFGLLFTAGDEFSDVLSDVLKDPTYTAGLVFRLPASYDTTISLNASARLLGQSLPALDFNFVSDAVLYYDPMTIELGGTWKHSSWGRAYAQVDYQFWNRYQSPAFMIRQPQTTTGSIQVQPGFLPATSYRNIVIPRVGEEFKLSESVQLRVGYSYRPSILDVVPSEAGNYLDPPKHSASLGLGLAMHKLLGTETPVYFDINLIYQYLLRQVIIKSAGNELGDLTDSKIGSPGYVAGGTQYGGGMTLSILF